MEINMLLFVIIGFAIAVIAIVLLIAKLIECRRRSCYHDYLTQKNYPRDTTINQYKR